MVKNLPAVQETGVRKIPWRRQWLPAPVFLHGESHGQRNLAGYSPWGHKELDRTEGLTLSLTSKTIIFFYKKTRQTTAKGMEPLNSLSVYVPVQEMFVV